MQTGLSQREARRPAVVARARHWLAGWAADPHVAAAASLWLASKAAVVVLAWVASWVMRPSGPRAAPWAAAWEHWDATQFRVIAEYGYFGAAGHSMSNQTAFLPGYPLLLRGVHLLVPSWTAAELVVAAVASFFAILGLIRLAEDYQAGSGTRAAVFLLAAPAAVFLSVGYSESVFLAVALPGWLAARRGEWTRAGLLMAVACAVRVSGVFVLAGIAIMAVQAGRGPRGAGAAIAARLAVALLPLAGYEAYLYSRTGDWLAWEHAERAGWGRYFGNPANTLVTTWRAAFGSEFRPPLAFMFQLELGAVAVLAVLLAVLAWRRQWPEACYTALTTAALVAGTWYESVPRALLLTWPLWCGMAGLAVRRRAIGILWLAASVPLMCVTALLYLSGAWAG